MVVIKDVRLDCSSETCYVIWHLVAHKNFQSVCPLFLFLIISSSTPIVPPNSDLTLEVHLLSAVDAPELELLPPSERISLASKKRERGNFHYQRGDYAFAVNSYGIALQITETSSKGKKTQAFTVGKKLICSFNSYSVLWERESARFIIIHCQTKTIKPVMFSTLLSVFSITKFASLNILLNLDIWHVKKLKYKQLKNYWSPI